MCIWVGEPLSLLAILPPAFVPGSHLKDLGNYSQASFSVVAECGGGMESYRAEVIDNIAPRAKDQSWPVLGVHGELAISPLTLPLASFLPCSTLTLRLHSRELCYLTQILTPSTRKKWLIGDSLSWRESSRTLPSELRVLCLGVKGGCGELTPLSLRGCWSFPARSWLLDWIWINPISFHTRPPCSPMMLEGPSSSNGQW